MTNYSTNLAADNKSEIARLTRLVNSYNQNIDFLNKRYHTELHKAPKSEQDEFNYYQQKRKEFTEKINSFKSVN